MYVYVVINYNEHLQKSRKSAGLTQKSVEKALKLRSLSMRDYETGRLKLPVEVAIRLSLLYRVSLNDLLGLPEHIKDQRRGLDKFKSIFLKNKAQVLFLDPVIRAYLEDTKGDIFSLSIFDLLLKEESLKYKEDFVLEIGKILCALAASDKKITEDEIECVDYLMISLGFEKKLKAIKPFLADDYNFDKENLLHGKPHLKHFIIWILFIFAESDDCIRIEEINFIESLAELLLINRDNFLFIKKKFIKESL